MSERIVQEELLLGEEYTEITRAVLVIVESVT